MSRAKRRLDPGEVRRRESKPNHTLVFSVTYWEEYTAKTARRSRTAAPKYALSTRSRTRHSFSPLAGCPRSRKVFGYLPSPQILNEPKSFTQGPSGATGSDSRQTLSW